MTTVDKSGAEDSSFAQLTSEPLASGRTLTGPKMTAPETVFLKVAVSASAGSVRVKFDPVAVEEIRQTRELNRSIRLGFVPPVVSTR